MRRSGIFRWFSLLISFVILLTFCQLPVFVSGITGQNLYCPFNSDEDIHDAFYSYYAPSRYNIEATDENGTPYFQPCAPSLTWEVENGELIRSGSGDYAAGGYKRTGPAVLYFRQPQRNFRVEYDYLIGAASGWNWAALGFGAESMGGHFVNDGYMAYIEKEGTTRLYCESSSAELLSGTVQSFSDVSASSWIHASFTVIGDELTMRFIYTGLSGDTLYVESSAELADYDGGYIYLYSTTDNMRFRNLTLTVYSTVENIALEPHYYAETGTPLAEILPASVKADLDNGESVYCPVYWDSNTFDSEKEGIYNITGTVYSEDDTVIIPEGTETVRVFVEIGEHDPELTDCLYFEKTDDISDSFICYSSPVDYKFGEKDTDGNSYLSETLPELTWKADVETGGLVRCGEGDCAGGSGIKGASLLYLKDRYADFEITYEYCFSEANESWRWSGVGFGADMPGDAYQTDSYFAVVEKEGTVRLHMKSETGDPLARINSGANDKYGSEVDTGIAENTDTWHRMTVSVICGVCTISYDGNGPFTQSIPVDTSGYVYLFSSTQGMKFRNIRITRFYTGDTEHTIEVWPKEYETNDTNILAVGEISLGDEAFSFCADTGEETQKFSLTFPDLGGVRINGNQKGFFEPEKNRKISYNSGNGKIEMSAGDESAVFIYDEAHWSIKVTGGENPVVLDSDAVTFGYADGKLESVKYTFPISDGELFYGLGERYNGLVQNKSKVTLWNHDTTYHAEPASGDKTYSYANVPILHSTGGYTLFFNSTEYALADIGSTAPDELSFEFNGSIIDLFIWTGAPSENLVSYTDLTGKPYIPPKWAFNYWMGTGRTIWESGLDGGETPDQASVAGTLADIIDAYEAMGTPITAFYSEGAYIDNSDITFPLLQSRGIYALSWNRCSTRYKTMASLLGCSPTNLPLILSQTEQYKYFGNERYTYIDYSNPLSLTLIKLLYGESVNNGLRGLMIDMGEYIGEDTVFYNGRDGGEMHNLYSYYYAKAMNTAFTEMLGNNFVLFERSGCAGSQSFSTLFGGDQAAKWYGLKQQLSALMSSAASGFSIWGGDIGGLHGRPDDELYMRWVQFAAFSPLMREHGNTADDGLPWTYSEEAAEMFVEYYNLRKSMVDYIYGKALESGESGIPVTQTLAMAYPGDTSLATVSDEYIFCGDMLVAPVTDEAVTSRSVTLPSGIWYDLLGGEAVSGGRTVEVDTPADRIPVFLKSGSVINLSIGDSLKIPSYGDKKVLLVTPPEQDTETSFYEEGGEKTEYVLKRNNTDSFSLLCNGSIKADAIIIYGFEANGAVAGGAELPAINKGDLSYGFYTENGNTVLQLPAESKTVDLFKGDKILQKTNISEIYPVSEDELDMFMTSYSVPGNSYIEDTDSSGLPLFKQIDPSEIWSVPYPGMLERAASEEYISEGSRKGASAHYFDGIYTDFELSFSYCYNGTDRPWKWISAGFGADKIGQMYYDSGYLALVEQEGTVKLLGNPNNGKITTYRLSDEVTEGYPDKSRWYKFSLRVIGNTVTVSYDNRSFTYEMSDYNGGYVYLHCFTEKIRYADISITDLSGGMPVSGTRSEITVSKSVYGGTITADSTVCPEGRKVTVTATAYDGRLTAKDSLAAVGYNGNGIVVLQMRDKGDGSYSFTMPDYPVLITAHFYFKFDINNDGKTDIKDYVRMKKLLSDSGTPADRYAADCDSDGTVNALDLTYLKQYFLNYFV